MTLEHLEVLCAAALEEKNQNCFISDIMLRFLLMLSTPASS